MLKAEILITSYLDSLWKERTLLHILQIYNYASRSSKSDIFNTWSLLMHPRPRFRYLQVCAEQIWVAEMFADFNLIISAAADYLRTRNPLVLDWINLVLICFNTNKNISKNSTKIISKKSVNHKINITSLLWFFEIWNKHTLIINNWFDSEILSSSGLHTLCSESTLYWQLLRLNN